MTSILVRITAMRWLLRAHEVSGGRIRPEAFANATGSSPAGSVCDVLFGAWPLVSHPWRCAASGLGFWPMLDEKSELAGQMMMVVSVLLTVFTVIVL